MTREPDFRDLVGDEGSPEELERLRRMHDLLLEVGPPPELSPRLEQPPVVGESKVTTLHRRRPATVLALAAALAAAAFLVGYVVADKRTGFEAQATIQMHGIGTLKPAHASLDVGKRDSSGNVPLEMTVRGLERLPEGGWYELLLSKNGKPTLSCGDFTVGGRVRAVTVRMSVPYDLTERPKLFNGWVVTVHRPGVKATPVVMTT